MSKITFLGVWMTPDVGETVSLLINTDDNHNILIDCGTNLVSSLINKNIDPMEITDIIITHSHGDHISGLPTYLFYRLLIAPGILKKEVRPINIIGSESTLSTVKDYIKAAYQNLVENSNINYINVVPQNQYSIGETDFVLFETKHQPETIGFSTYLGGKHVVYSSDTALSEDILEFAKNADILIHDVVGTSKFKMLSGAHTICSDISPMLEKYHVKSFYPVHRLSIYSKDTSDYYAELSAEYNGHVFIPNDGDIIKL